MIKEVIRWLLPILLRPKPTSMTPVQILEMALKLADIKYADLNFTYSKKYSSDMISGIYWSGGAHFKFRLLCNLKAFTHNLDYRFNVINTLLYKMEKQGGEIWQYQH